MSRKLPISLRTLLIICLVLLVPPIMVYILNFKDQPVSKDGSDWADFASFLGGILGPVYAFLNIIVVYYLALIVEGAADSRRKSDELQENQRRKNDFKYNAYKELHDIILKLIEYCINRKDASPLLLIHFKYTLSAYSRLFTVLNNELVQDLTDQVTRVDEMTKDEKLQLIGKLNKTLQELASELGF